MRDLYVQANGLRLHVVDYGGDGTPLLLVHGTGLVAQVWAPVARALTPEFRVLALARRGHGESETPASGYQWYDTAADIAGVIQALGIDGCPAAGHSSGATPLLMAAGDHPGLIGRMVLVEPMITARRTAPAVASAMVERTRRRRAHWPSAREMFDSLGSRPPFASWHEDALWAYVQHGTRLLPDGGVELRCRPEIEALMYQHDGTTDVYERLAAVPGPMLLVRAEHSDRVSRQSVERGCAAARLSVRTRRASHAATNATGVLANRVQRHDAYWVRKPPRSSPRAPPPAEIAPYTPKARVRSRGRVNVTVSSDSAAGAISAANIPCAPRDTNSHPASVARPAVAEAAPNPSRPMMNVRLRPV